MANIGGKSGSVSITSNSSGSNVIVSYPADPGPPQVPAHTDEFNPAPDWLVRRAEHCMPPLRLDVTVDGSGNPILVTAHA